MYRLSGRALAAIAFLMICVAAAFSGRLASRSQAGRGPFQVTGIRICEVTPTSAIVWARLTRNPRRVGKEAPMPEVFYRDPATGRLTEKVTGRPDQEPVVVFPRGSGIETIEGAVPGAPGEARVSLKPRGALVWRASAWHRADPQRDFTAHIPLKDLSPATTYELKVECRSGPGAPLGQTVAGGFRTGPQPGQAARVVFTVTTGQAYPDQDAPGGGFKIYGQMLKLDPSFFVHTGDIVYYDRLAKSLPLARWHWARTYSLPTNVEFHRQVASYFIKDDHDTWRNDCWPAMQTKYMGEFTFAQGQAVFLEQVGMSERTYRTFRWGKDLQVWLVEGRDFRSPNDMPDGPEKTIWGKQQKDWFKRTVLASDAAFRILISPTPLVGPDRANKNDNHANKGFTHEGDDLRSFISQQKNMYIVCGDRHWQYVSVHARTGVREYSCGPASNQHAGGWSNDMRYPEHRYVNVTGGFLAGIVDRQNGKPVLVFRHYSVDGEVLNEDRLEHLN